MNEAWPTCRFRITAQQSAAGRNRVLWYHQVRSSAHNDITYEQAFCHCAAHSQCYCRYACRDARV